MNTPWLKDETLTSSAHRFLDTVRDGGALPDRDWTELRDQWERSHMLRAATAMLGLILLVAAVALYRRSARNLRRRFSVRPAIMNSPSPR